MIADVPRKTVFETLSQHSGASLRKASTVRGRQTNGRSLFEIEWDDSAILAPYFDAVWILTTVLDEILDAHYKAIKAGERPDDGSLQEKLDPRGTQGQRAAAGQRPNVRGWTGRTDGRSFPDQLQRDRVGYTGKVVRIGNGKQGMSASGVIRPGLEKHVDFCKNEISKRGIEYFSVEGRIDDLIESILKRLIDEGIQGAPTSEPDPAERKANQRSKRRRKS